MYKITVIDLDTGETCVDAETNCVVGGFLIPSEKAAQVLALTACSVLEIGCAINAAESAIKHLNENPAIAMARGLARAIAHKTKGEED